MEDKNQKEGSVTKNLAFGHAFAQLTQWHKKGLNPKMYNENWNGNGMFICVAGDYEIQPENLRPGTMITAEFLKEQNVPTMKIAPHLDLWNADKTYVSGWSPSQMDLFSNRWVVEY